jgi:transcriptional regulator with XRE-family HTH domain
MATDLQSPVGSSAVEAAQGRAKRSPAYRDARAEYERIRALREISPIAAHLRERRFEMGLTQEEVAKAADTSHSAVSRLEKGTHIPQLPTLQRIAAVLDEELLVCFQRTVDGERLNASSRLLLELSLRLRVYARTTPGRQKRLGSKGVPESC